jgi:hypothetical protein
MPPPETRAAFADLAQLKLDEGDLPAILARVADLARRALPGAYGASVTLVEADRPYTVAFTGQLALDRDETQYADGRGPCLEVAQASGIVLIIYATAPGAFGGEAAGLAQTLAGCAAVAIANARLYQTTATLAENMHRAMETRAVIEQAKGILIAKQHCTPEYAFELLTRLSQVSHRKLRDCAADLVASTARSL